MKFVLKKPRGNPIVFLRSLGYHFQREDKVKKELVLYHPLTGFAFPRFHLYLKVEENNLICNLHLDQKKPVYRGAPAHSADYRGPVVRGEAERVKKAAAGP
jgi:hypothetical protein